MYTSPRPDHTPPLIRPQHPRPPSLPPLSPLPLVPLLKRHSLLMRPPQIILRLHLVNPDDPILTRERLLHRTQLGTLRGQFRAAHTVGGLAGGEERVVVVVAHLVHEAVAHGGGRFVVDAVFAARGEEVAFFDFVGPDA